MLKRETYRDFLKDKTVCVVGPAPTIKDIHGNLYQNQQQQIDKINSYDLVVRLNKSLPIPDSVAEFTGNRTDIIYNGMTEQPDGPIDIDYLETKIQWLVSSLPAKYPFINDIARFDWRNQNRINFTVPENEFFDNIEKEMRTRPYTGVMAILDMLSFDIKEMFITGITFFRGGYVPEYRNQTEEEALKIQKAHGNHQQEPQIEYMKKVLLSDPRVTIDKHLQNIFEKI